MNGTPTSHLPALLTALTGLFVAVAALLGWWLNRKRQPADVRLLWLQGDVQEATRHKLEAERESLAVASMEKALQAAERTIDRLERERDAWKLHAGNAEGAKEAAESKAREADARMRAMEGQMQTLHAFLKSKGIEYPS